MEKHIYLKSVTAEVLSKIEVTDWLEGYGMVMSLSERDHIRTYGYLLIALQDKNKSMREVLQANGRLLYGKELINL